MRGAVYAVAIATAVLVLDAVYAGVRIRTALLTANTRLTRAGELVLSGTTSDAVRELEAALRAAASARNMQRHPGLLLASHLPAVGPDVATAGALSHAAELTARAALSVIESSPTTSNRGLWESLYRRGRVHVDAMRRIDPGLARAESLLKNAARVLDGAPIATLPFLRDISLEARATVGRAASAAHDARALLRVAPTIFGQESPRRYLLAFQSPSEARGTGGFMGLYGVLTARNGRVDLGRVGPVEDLLLHPSQAVSGPSWFEARYEPFAGMWQWQQANLAGDFPSVARVWLRMYRRSTGVDLDGVVAMDPLALGQMTRATGPVVGRGWPVEVSYANASRVLLHDVYERFEARPEAQNRYLASLVGELWRRLTRSDVGVGGLALGLIEAVSTQHLKVYVGDDRAEATLSDAGVDGSFRASGDNVQFLWHNNLAANKVDYFMRRSISTTVVLTQAGNAKVLSEVRLRNSAPEGPPSELIGSGVGGDRPGLNRMQVNLLLPRDARIDRYALAGRVRPVLSEEEAGFPVLWDIVEVQPQSTISLQVAYTVPGAVDLSSGHGAFEMTLFPQALVTPDSYSVRVVPPYEYSIAHSTEGRRDADGSIVRTGTLSRETSISVDLVRT